MTQKNKRVIKWYALLPALLSTLVGILEVLYQIISFKKSGIFTGEHGSSFAYEIFGFIADLIKNDTRLSLIILPLVGLLLILNFTLPPLAKSATIQLLTRFHNGQQFLLRDGVKYGSNSYLRMLGYESTIKDFSLLLIFSVFSFVLRHYGLPVLSIILIPFIILGIISIILSILLTYTEYFIVIDELGFAAAMKKSIKMSLYFWEHTVLLIIFIIIIGLRVIINTIFILLIPTVIILLTSLVSVMFIKEIGLIIGIGFGVVGYFLASYINAVVDVWAYSVWIITFITLSSFEGDKNINDIEEENQIEEIKQTKEMDITSVELE